MERGQLHNTYIDSAGNTHHLTDQMLDVILKALDDDARAQAAAIQDFSANQPPLAAGPHAKEAHRRIWESMANRQEQIKRVTRIFGED